MTELTTLERGYLEALHHRAGPITATPQALYAVATSLRQRGFTCTKGAAMGTERLEITDQGMVALGYAAAARDQTESITALQEEISVLKDLVKVRSKELSDVRVAYFDYRAATEELVSATRDAHDAFDHFMSRTS